MIWALHGAFGALTDWHGVQHALEHLGGPTETQWGLVDLWEQAAGAFSLDETATVLADVILAHDDAPVLAGYSLGGRIALHLLAQWPTAFRAAFIVSAHPGLTSEADRAARLREDGLWAERLEALPWSAFWQRWNHRGALATSPPLPPPVFRPAMRRALTDWSLGTQADLRRQLARVATPTTWLAGTSDPGFHALALEMAALMPSARAVGIPGGHRLLSEAPEPVAEALHRALR